MVGRQMTDAQAMALAKELVAEAIKKSHTPARIDRVYHVHDRDLYRVAVIGPDGKEAQLGFAYTELTEEIDKSRQKARLFMTELRKPKTKPN